ncbi:ABC transporter ATP-binding protein [soil metagenome]
MGLLRELSKLFNRREKWQLSLLFAVLLLRAATVTIGVASIMPFMSVVANPEVIHTNVYLAAVYEYFRFTSPISFLTALGIVVVAVIILSNGVSALATWATVRFSWGMHHRLSMRLLRGYLHQPYSFFVERNSAVLNKTLLTEVNVVISGIMAPVLDIGSRFLVIAALLALLVRVDPTLAVAISGVLGTVYGSVYLMIKQKQRRLGRERVQANELRFRASGEAFGGIKDVKVLQREHAFLRKFQPASWRYSTTNASNAVISQMPNYLLDTIAFAGIILIVLYYLQAGNGVVQILPVISLYAFAGYRLMPELKKLFSDFAKIRFHRAALDDLLEVYFSLPEATDESAVARLPFDSRIEFKDVHFRYPSAPADALNGISVSIGRNQIVGLVGASGSGKTTLVDLLLGLYEADSGIISIDGVPLNSETIGAWRQQVGYVPQHIFLTDDTLAANVAFGVPKGEVDFERIVLAARIAHLTDYIAELPDGYDTVVGERGVRLSGGQRQRIGIARALYHDPEVLIMDEATSALDGATENAVMEAISDLAGKKTIILIAHRLSTVRECDAIFVLTAGQLEQSGTYEYLLQENPSFREFAGLPT